MPPPLDPFAQWFIPHKARQLLHLGRRVGFDASDIEQELFLHLVQRSDRFDAARARWTTFVKVVTNSHAATLARRWRNGSSDRMESLDSTGADVSESASDRAPQESWELQQDVRETVSTLTVPDQTLCAGLSETSKVDAAGLAGMARSTAYIHIDQLRQIFESRQLREYL